MYPWSLATWEYNTSPWLFFDGLKVNSLTFPGLERGNLTKIQLFLMCMKGLNPGVIS